MSEFSTNFNFLQSQELKKREAMACEELFGLINHTIFKLFELDMQAKNQAPDDELYLLTTSLSFTKVINDEQKLQHTLGVVLYPDEESSSHIYKQAELLVPVDNRFNLSMSPLNLDERYDPKQVYIELERNDGKKERYVIDGRTNQILTFDYVDEPEKIEMLYGAAELEDPLGSVRKQIGKLVDVSNLNLINTIYEIMINYRPRPKMR